ncbi:hypothetical protein HIM_07686 [Hirsutella minnesotensis 3608]|uniref:EF-hand domain-containing protein n=1 Tax=Hirsutella minnesotensis 3608 TaxID=1043627 RepID=A0A0F7ZTD5_9HYPO|nr:hypothetical protein HIM_07686 [Hirsutella minnesotensis 3608]
MVGNQLAFPTAMLHEETNRHHYKAASTAYKPSPLGYGSSPRSSPFRRSGSPVTPSSLRVTSPDSSPTKNGLLGGTARLARPKTPMSANATFASRQANAEQMSSPPPLPALSPRGAASNLGNGSALSQLQPSQVRSLRDGFQILDRDCDGVVNKEDVADMLSQLGLPNRPADVARFFPPSRPQTIALAAFLNSLAEVLATLSPSAELLSAFSAFDDDDSGQVDWAELRHALLNTPPENGEIVLSEADVNKVVNGFTGRRAFNRNMNAQLGAKKGEVFRYQEFVSSIMGSNGGADGESQEGQEE